MNHKPLTIFQNRVYSVLKTIPRGKVTTYKLLARKLKCGSCQAVGQALKKNPYAPQVPCHRVISSDLRVGGFKGKKVGRAIKEKLAMLEKEGVRFQDGKLSDKKHLFRF